MLLAALLVLPCSYDSHNPDASPSDSHVNSSDASARRSDMHAKWVAATTDDVGHRPLVPPTQPDNGKHDGPLVPANQSSDGGAGSLVPPTKVPPTKPVNGGHDGPLVPPTQRGDGGHAGALVPPDHTSDGGHAETVVPPMIKERTHSDFKDAEKQLLVVSLGGLGVATMIKELSSIPKFEAQLNADKDLRYLPFGRLVSEQPEKIANVNRILYLWGEPTRTLKSIYRRGYQTFMAQKTRSDHFEGSTFDANVAFWGVPKNLDEYANASHDTFEMQKHIESYLDAPSDGTFLPKIAFLQIEKKTANLGRLANFLNLPEAELTAKLSPWEFASRAELAAEQELGMGVGNMLSYDLPPQFSGEQVAAVEDSIATIATTRMMSGNMAYDRNELSLEQNFDLAHDLAVKVNAKFINMRSIMYGFLAHHDGLFVRREGEPHPQPGEPQREFRRLATKPAPLKPAPKGKPAPLSPAPKGNGSSR